MIILTTLGAHRCSVPPDRIVAVEAGPPTTLVLQGGLTVAVREDAPEVARRLEAARNEGATLSGNGRGRR